MGLLDGKVAIITGAGGGLGRCHALLFAKEGAKVVVNDVGGSRDGTGGDDSMADKVVAEIKAAGGEAVANYDSVATMEGGQAILKTALDAFGRADILVNNAGILRDKTMTKLEEAHWDAVIAVHLKGTFACSQAFARHVKERADAGDPGGKIVNTSSYAGLKGNFGQTNYAAAKAGIYGMTLVWSQELARSGVQVNCIAPMAKTRMTDDIDMVPDTMKPEQISPMVLFLASSLADDVNGRIFGCHGNQMLEYKMLMTDGVTKEGEAPWSAEEIQAKLEAIGAEAAAPAAAAPAAAARPLTDTDIIAAAFKAMPEVFVPEKAKGWNAVIQFDIKDGEPWTMTIADGTCTTAPGKQGTPTCVVNVDAKTYSQIVQGKEKPEKAFMAGKIRATNLGDMMKFGSAFDMKKAKQLAEKAKAAHASAAAPAAAAPKALTDNDIIAAAFKAMPEVFLPEKAKGWNAVIQFDIKDGEPWTMTVADGTCATAPGKEGTPTCVVNVDAKTYSQIVQGKEKPEKAFMAGKIRATNLGDMMKFGSAFDMKKAKQLAEEAKAKLKAGAAPAAAAPKPVTDDDIIAAAFTAMPKVFVPEKAKGWNAVIQFDIKDGSPWTVIIADGACKTVQGKEGTATCVVSVDAKTYSLVVQGKEKPEKAFMAGKIRATNLGDMMKFGTAFDMKKAKAMAEEAKAKHKAGAAPAAAPAAAAPPSGPGETVDRAFGVLPQVFKPEAVSGWNAVVQFAIEGGNDWTVTIKDGTCSTAQGQNGTATCVVTTSVDAYGQIVSGTLKAEQAFFQKKIQATNLGDMMKFGRAFDMKKAKELMASAAPAAAPQAGGMNRDCIGRNYACDPIWVKPDMATEFAKATADENAAYLGEGATIAPPMLNVRLLKDAMFKPVVDEALGADLLRLVHGEQDMTFHKPLKHWDLCATRSKITGIETKSSGELLHVEERLYAGGELACTVKASMFIRASGGKKKKKSGDGEKKAEEAHEIVFSDEITVDDGRSLTYADASGDNNPIHTDEEVAKLAGFPGVILQGLCTMSFAQKAVVNKLASGDPTRLKRLGVRFAKPVLIGDTLTTEGWDVDETEGVKSYGFRVKNQHGDVVISNGIAEVSV